MGQVVLPPSVAHSMALEASLEELGRARARGEFLRDFDRRLKQIDSRLSLERARDVVSAPGLVPGFWHVRRDNREFGAPDSYYPIRDADGGFVEPSEGVLEHLRRSDLQRPGALEELRRAEEARAADRRSRMAAEREARVDEIAGRIKAIESPGVLFGTPGWTNRKRGKR